MMNAGHQAEGSDDEDDGIHYEDEIPEFPPSTLNWNGSATAVALLREAWTKVNTRE